MSLLSCIINCKNCQYCYVQISPDHAEDEEINLNDEEPEVKVEAAETKLEAAIEESSTSNPNPDQTSSSSPGVIQYLFGCLPCVGNPK